MGKLMCMYYLYKIFLTFPFLMTFLQSFSYSVRLWANIHAFYLVTSNSFSNFLIFFFYGINDMMRLNFKYFWQKNKNK